MEASECWNALDAYWQASFDEAWTSWAGGSAGVGAVVVDESGEIVARGRNRMLEPRTEPGVLASTPLAHAEMNTLAQLSHGKIGGTAIYTTFEPCLMCASTIVQQHVAHVHYAVDDPLFEGMHDWFGDLTFAAERIPTRSRLGGPMGAFAHVLHLSWLSFWMNTGVTIEAHREAAPGHLALAAAVAADNRLTAIAREGGSTLDALDALWADIESLVPVDETD